MKFVEGKVLLVCILCCALFSPPLCAQFYNNGSQVAVSNGGIIYIKGDLINHDSSMYNAGLVVVEGNCIVKNKPTSRILTSNGDSLVVFGDFRDSSLKGQNSGVLVLKGANQTIGSTSNILANLALNGVGDKTLASNIYVRYNLNLKNGHIIVPTSYNFGLDSTSSLLPSSPTSSSFVVGNMSRKRKLGSEDSLFFPIGNIKTQYRPVSLLGIGTATSKYPVYTMGTSIVSPQSGWEVTTVYNRAWRFLSTDTTVPVSNIKLYYLAADVASAPASSLVVSYAKSPNGFYSSIGNKTANSTYVVSDLKPSPGYFALASSNNLKANFKLFLEGPFNGTLMSNSLYANSVLKDLLLPSTGMLPGYEVPAGAVDRIGFIAQDSITMAYTDTAYAWLLQDGSIKDYMTGTRSYVTFSKAITSTRYFVIAQHRNHLPASSKSIVLSPSLPAGYSYDYSKGVYGGGALFNIGANVWTLYASDPYKSTKNQTDVIDLLRVGDDNDQGTYRQAGTYYYRYTDLNLDGVVNAADRQIASEHNNKLYYSTLK